MAEEIKIKITLDSGQVVDGFLQVEKQAEKTGKKIGGSLGGNSGFAGAVNGVKNLGSSVIGLLGPYGAAAAAIGLAGKKLFDFAISGEKVNAVNMQFKNIAQSAGLAADQFGNSIVKATQGLIDDEDALQIATKGIVALGDQASKLPGILDASRSVSRGLGKDFKETFQDLSQFVETGNARVLKNLGIVLDLDKAYQAAAKSIGLTTADLTEFQKQQIRANLILDEVPKKFSAAAQSVTPLSDAFDRAKVSASNFFEKLSSGFSETISKTFIDDSNFANVATSRLSKNAEEVATQISNVKSRIEEIKLDKLGSKSVQASAELQSLNTTLKELTEQSKRLFVELGGRSDEELFRQLDASKVKKTEEVIKLTEDQKKIRAEQAKKRESDLTAFLAQQNTSRLQSELEKVNASDSLNQRITSTELLKNQQLELLQFQHEEKLRQTKMQFSIENGFTKEQRDAAELASIAAHNAQKLQIEDEAQRQISEMKKKEAQETAIFTQFTQDSFAAVALQAKKSLAQGVGNAFSQFGQALGRGEDASEAFTKAIGAAIGKAAAAFGDFFIQAGIGRIAASFGADATGYAMLAAGIALNAIAGSLGGGGGGASQTSSDTGGGIAAAPSQTTEFTPEQAITRQEPGTQVSLVVQGDILDSDESGSRIVELINEAFSNKGVVINREVIA